jgi:hypothetical protein
MNAERPNFRVNRPKGREETKMPENTKALGSELNEQLDPLIRQGDKIRILKNLGEVLVELEYDARTAQNMHDRFAGTEQTAYAIWLDHIGEKHTTYVTVDLCCEIPIQCCERAQRKANRPEGRRP